MTNLYLPKDLVKRSRRNGLNPSAVARRALKEACERLETIESGANLPGPTPDTSSQGVAQ